MITVTVVVVIIAMAVVVMIVTVITVMVVTLITGCWAPKHTLNTARGTSKVVLLPPGARAERFMLWDSFFPRLAERPSKSYMEIKHAVM